MFNPYGNSSGLWQQQQQQQPQQQQGRVMANAGQALQQPYQQYANGTFHPGGAMSHQQQQLLLQKQLLSNSSLLAPPLPPSQHQSSTTTSQTFLAPSSRPTKAAAAFTPGLMGAPPLPPPPALSSSSLHPPLPPPPRGSGDRERAEERKQAALQRKQEHQERLMREKALHEHGSGINLFDRPEKVQSDNSSVASVLGDYRNAQKIINSHSSCIGIDYQPPTPAPMQHIIGDDDESETRPQRRPPATIPRPPSHQRLPPENFVMMHRPAKPTRPGMPALSAAGVVPGHPLSQMTSGGNNVGMPNGILHHNLQMQQHQRLQQQRLEQQRHMAFPMPSSNGQVMGNVSRMKQASQNLQKINLEPGDDDLQEILREMKDPLFSEGKMPAPLSAIFTPKVTSHEGNHNRNGAPKYFSGFPPNFMTTNATAPSIVSKAEISQLEEQEEQVISPATHTMGASPGVKSWSTEQRGHSSPTVKPFVDPKFANNVSIPNVRGVRLSESDSDEDDKYSKKSSSSSGAIVQKPTTPLLHPPPTFSTASTTTSKEAKFPTPVIVEPPNQQLVTKTSNSSSESSSDSDSDSEDEDESNHSSSDPEASGQQQDECYSLGSLLGKVKSTHSPGPNPHPSPRVGQQIPNPVKMCPEDEEGISELLSHTPQQALPDLVDPISLGGFGGHHDLLESIIGQPLSPLEPNTPPSLSPMHARSSAASTKRTTTSASAGRLAARRQSSTLQSQSSFQDSSDEEHIPTASKHRRPRKSKAQAPQHQTTKKSAAAATLPSSAMLQSSGDRRHPPQKQQQQLQTFGNGSNKSAASASWKRSATTGSSKSEKHQSRQQPKKPQLSRALISPSEDFSSSDDQSSNTTPVPTPFTSSGSRNVNKPFPSPVAQPRLKQETRQIDSDDSHGSNRNAKLQQQQLISPSSKKRSSRMRASDNESTDGLASVKAENRHGSGGGGSGDSPKNMPNVKKQFLNKIFAGKSSTKPNAVGGKGGKGGKGGITVERVVVQQQQQQPPQLLQHQQPQPLSPVLMKRESKDFPRPRRRRRDGRPSLLCQIPINLLNRNLDVTVNAFLLQLRAASASSVTAAARIRRQSGESVSSSGSKRSHVSNSSKRSRDERGDNSASKRPRTTENALLSDGGGFDDDYYNHRQSSAGIPMAGSVPEESDERLLFGGGGSSATTAVTTPGSTAAMASATAASQQQRSSGGSAAGEWTTRGSTGLMPPPTKMYFSYLEQRVREEEEDTGDEDVTTYMSQAKRLKHEADKESDRERQAMKYLQAVLFFILCGNLQEQRGDKTAAFTMYKETLSLIKHVCRPFRNSDFGNFDNKLAVLSLRCQSLMYLKLYKICRHDLKECQKIIGDHIQKANASQQNSPINSTISPTPSPAGSEGSVCSKSSGYTSAGELGGSGGNGGGGRVGVLTPPTSSGGAAVGGGGGGGLQQHQPVLSVPQFVMQKQHQYCNYLSQCHELWEMADVYANRGHCADFIIRLDQTCGPLTLHSSLKDLVKYTQSGLDYVSQDGV